MQGLQNLLSVLAVAASLGTNALAGEFVYEQGSGSTWYSADDDGFYEWKQDGTLTNHIAPFTNLQYPGSVIPFANEDRQITSTFGAFSVAYKYRTLFRRQDGVMVREEFFDKHPDLGCTDSAAGYCMFFPIEIPNVGNGVVVFDPAFNTRFWIEQGQSYREPSTLENELFMSDVLVDFWIAGDGSQGLLVNENENSHTVVLKQDSQESSLDIDTYIPEMGSDVTLLKVDEQFFLFVSYTGYSNSSKVGKLNKKDPAPSALRLYAIDIVGQAITARLVVDKSFPMRRQPEFLAMSSTDLTVSSGGKIINYHLLQGTASVLVECDKDILVADATIESFGHKGIAVCRRDLYVVTPGSVGARHEFSFEPDDAGFVRHHPDGQVVIAYKEGQRIEAIMPDGSRNSHRFGSFVAAPKLEKVWLENDRPCGVVKDIEDRYLCQSVSGTWQEKEFAHGVITDITRQANSWWALAVRDQVAVVLNLSVDNAGLDIWQVVTTLPSLPGKKPRFIATGNDKPGIDIGSGSSYVFSGQDLVPLYSRQRPDRAFDLFDSVIDTQGQLYDFCSIEDYTAKICVYLPDGTKLETGYETYAFSTGGIVLERGVLISGVELFRGVRHIPLANIYGQLDQYFSSFPLGDRKIGVIISETQSSSGKPELYSYDGKDLVPIADDQRGAKKIVTPHLGRKALKLPKARFKSTQPEDPADQENKNFMFQDVNGMWVRVGSDGAVVRKMSLFALLMEGSAVGANFFSDALTVGDTHYVVNKQGVWSCPDNAFAVVTSASADIPLASGCELKRVEPGLTKLASIAGKFVALRGKRLLLLADLDDEAPMTLSRSARVTDFFQSGDKVYWVEDHAAFTFDVQTLDVQQVQLDPAARIKKFADGWLCGSGGLYWQGEHADTKVLPDCQDLTNESGAALAVSGRFAYRCASGVCGDPLELPLAWKADSSLGLMTLGGSTKTPVVAFANQIYALDETLGQFTPLNLNMAGGKNLLFSPVLRLREHFIATDGGGLVRLRGSAATSDMQQSILRFE